jgi:hypothetical protein
MTKFTGALGFALALVCLGSAAAAAQTCDKACLEDIATKYRAAYVKHDPSMIPLAKHVRFSENNVEMPFPDASWDTVTKEVGSPLVFSDPQTGQVAIITAIMQRDIQGYLCARLRVENGQITEIEHMLSTKRNLSSPPTPIGDVEKYVHEPVIEQTVPASERVSREELLKLGDGYFKTLQQNDGTLHSRFAPDATRRENGMVFKDIAGGFRTGTYLFNNRVRRMPVLVDEERQIVLFRGFIDHKGVLDTYKTTDGKDRKSIFQEPQSWALLESFKIKDNAIAAVEAVFIQGQYNQHTPWSKALDPEMWIPSHIDPVIK